MSMQYIRDYYGINVRRGMKVKCKAWDGWIEGKITSCNHYVNVKTDKWPNRRFSYHPLDRDYLVYLESTDL